MDKLPSEIIITILSTLPIKSLISCRCVCKSWLNLTHDSQLITTHLHRSSQNEDNLSIIFVSCILINPTHFRTRLSFIDNNYGGTNDNYTCVDLNLSIPNLNKFEVLGSCNGLLCLFDPLTKTLKYICNPCNGAYAPLPNPIRPSPSSTSTSTSTSSPLPLEVAVGFGYLPQSNVYKVIELVYYSSAIFSGDSRPEAHVLTLGDRSWRHIGNAPFSLIRGSKASQAFVNGALHWLSDSPGFDCIVSFDVGEEQFGVVPHPEFESGQLHYRLGVLRGCLSAANYSYAEYAEMWVMNEYGVKESWTRYFKVNCSEVGLRIGFVRPLCRRRSDEVLLLHGSSSLLCYDPITKRLKELSIATLPPALQVVTHVGSLVSPHSMLDCLVEENNECTNLNVEAVTEEPTK
ncbi:unnamed protein product [Camellia sinensis]